MMTDIDKLLPRSIHTMTVEQLRELKNDVLRFEYKIIERIQKLEAPPALGVSVAEGVGTDEKVS